MNRHIILMGLVVLLTMLCSQVIADEKTFSSPGIGYIEIRSEIEGARVYFDTLYMGYVSGGSLTIPVDTSVAPSWKNVRVEYSGYAPYAGPFIQTEPTKTIAYLVNLSKTTYDNFGIVKFVSDPVGAEFFLNNVSMGATPDSGVLIAYTVPRGLYAVSARRPGDKPVSDQLYVDDNALTTYRVEIIPSPFGELQVNSSPEGGDIYLDNRVVGLTPLKLTGISVGEHGVQVRKAGYQDWVANVSITGGSMGSIEAVLVSTPQPESLPSCSPVEPGKQ